MVEKIKVGEIEEILQQQREQEQELKKKEQETFKELLKLIEKFGKERFDEMYKQR